MGRHWLTGIDRRGRSWQPTRRISSLSRCDRPVRPAFRCVRTARALLQRPMSGFPQASPLGAATLGRDRPIDTRRKADDVARFGIGRKPIQGLMAASVLAMGLSGCAFGGTPAAAGSSHGSRGAAGPRGSVGPRGPRGPAGPPGPIGLTGARGATGPMGPTGARGPAGPMGLRGATGARGLMGPMGPTGPTGASGPAGPSGPTGPQGPAGTNGTTVLSGTMTPSSSLGAVGDFYLDTATVTLYGPKTSTGWPASGTSLVGPQGPAGPGAQVFSAPGIYPYTVPTGVSEIEVEIWGGGGGGGGSGSSETSGAGGGGAGGFLKILVPVSAGVTTCGVTVGYGGLGGLIPPGPVLGSTGAPGGPSSIACGTASASASGGGGGSRSTGGSGGTDSATAGTVLVAPSGGAGGVANGSEGGSGGGYYYDTVGGAGGTSTSVTGSGGPFVGAGGGGGGAEAAGGQGAQGLVIVIPFSP